MQSTSLELRLATKTRCVSHASLVTKLRAIWNPLGNFCLLALLHNPGKGETLKGEGKIEALRSREGSCLDIEFSTSRACMPQGFLFGEMAV